MKRVLAIIAVIFAFVGLILIMLGVLTGRIHESGTGPNGGEYHITSGGNVSYYSPKTGGWGPSKSTNIPMVVGGIVLLVFGVIFGFASFLSNQKTHVKESEHKVLREQKICNELHCRFSVMNRSNARYCNLHSTSKSKKVTKHEIDQFKKWVAEDRAFKNMTYPQFEKNSKDIRYTSTNFSVKKEFDIIQFCRIHSLEYSRIEHGHLIKYEGKEITARELFEELDKMNGTFVENLTFINFRKVMKDR